MSGHKALTKRPPPASYTPRDYDAPPKPKLRRLTLAEIFEQAQPKEYTPKLKRIRAERMRRRKHRQRQK